jgi:type III pantothenate kinase
VRRDHRRDVARSATDRGGAAAAGPGRARRRPSEPTLTVDVGNTRVTAAIVRGDRVLARAELPSDPSALEAAAALRGLVDRAGGSVGGAALASVVPRRTARWRALTARAAGRPPLVLSPASRVGADRIANALAARLLSGGRDAVVVDVGTAVTVDVVTSRGTLEGGFIAPGPRLGARSLARYTAQLPEVSFRRSRGRLGRSTRAAIRAGLWHGFRGLVRALVAEALRARPGARVFVAGGDGEACLRGGGIRYRAAPGLTHLGLARALEIAEGGRR